MIIFEDVSKHYGKRTILDGINLSIAPGEFVSVVGNSGAGKTTLIKLILGVEQPNEGVLTVHDNDLRYINEEALQQYRRNIGCVFQDYKLLPNKTVFENVAFALESCNYSLPNIIEMVPQALESVGIAHLQDQFPHELSGGEAQRVSIARAIVHKPRIVLADEPTGNLDFETAKQVLKQLIKINMAGTTVLLTTHNKPLVELVGQKVVHLDNGKLF